MSKLLEAASAGDIEKLLDLWMEALEGEPPWADMAEVVGFLASTELSEPACDLIGLAIDEKELDGGKGFESFLTSCAGVLHRCEPLRKSLVELLRDRHLMFQPLEHFMKISGLKDQGADVAVSWSRFGSLMNYRDGGFLYHPAFGTGMISRISRTHVTVDFPGSQNHDMQLEVMLDTTVPLEAEALAVLAMEDPEGFRKLVSDSPREFLERLLHEPYIREGAGISRDDLVPLASSLGVDGDDLWKTVKKAASAAGGFADLGERVVALDESMALLEQLRGMIRERKVPASEKVHRVQSMIRSFSGPVPKDLSPLLPEVAGLGSPESGALFELSWILCGRGTSARFLQVRDRYTESSAARAERALAEIHSQSCRKAYVESFFMKAEEEGEKMSLLSSLKRSLWEHAVEFLERTDPDLLYRCITSYLSQPSMTDLFLWSLTYIASKGDGSGAASGEGGPGYGIELFLDNIIYASADTQKKVIGLLTGPLREELSEFLESIDTRRLGKYLETFDTSATAHNEGLFLAVGRELSRRKSTGMRRSGRKHFWEGGAVFSSRESIRRREEEIRKLKQEEIPAAAEAIGVAASHGDLSENAEYAAAMEKRDLLLDRLKRWSEELQIFRPYPPEKIGTEVVSPGVRVTLQDTGESEEVQVLEIVGPLDSDPDLGRINYMAPIGHALLGRSQGEITELPGSDGTEWRIVSIEVLDMVGGG